ncbi:hypothetical protein EKO27_g7603 [Xylaria grammica]|uniref:Uncharacterized protein n=1 Tax=Xylaria grammica TaxID=363999 RepID=A0A439CZ67_9PEZI|nr:hypothetical protein EKO27_g7603 [Xylaria grammica]
MSRRNRLNLALEVGFQPAPENRGSPQALDDDSYLNELEDRGEELYKQLLLGIASANGECSLAEQRRMTSQHAKNIDEDWIPPKWTPEMRRAHADYKEFSKQITPARTAAAIAKRTYFENRLSPEGPALRLKFLESLRECFRLSMSSAQMRVDFAVKYPGAFDSQKAEGHIKAVKYDLNSARFAYGTLQAYM